MLNDLPRVVLKKLVNDHGRTLCNDPRRVEGMLRDLCGVHKREINLLVSALQAGVAAELTGHSAAVPIEVTAARLSQRLHENMGFAEEFCRWAVESWAETLGIQLRVDGSVVESAVITPKHRSEPSGEQDVEPERQDPFAEDGLMLGKTLLGKTFKVTSEDPTGITEGLIMSFCIDGQLAINKRFDVSGKWQVEDGDILIKMPWSPNFERVPYYQYLDVFITCHPTNSTVVYWERIDTYPDLVDEKPNIIVKLFGRFSGH